MKRTLLAIFTALVSWVVVVSLLNLILRHGIEGYAAAEPGFSFTLGMLLARLLIAAVSSLAAGAVAAWIAPGDARAAWISGIILLVVFLPEHVKLWHSFPVWYHLTFLATLVPLVILGARLARPAAAQAPRATA
jgi:hypothetical protein